MSKPTKSRAPSKNARREVQQQTRNAAELARETAARTAAETGADVEVEIQDGDGGTLATAHAGADRSQCDMDGPCAHHRLGGEKDTDCAGPGAVEQVAGGAVGGRCADCGGDATCAAKLGTGTFCDDCCDHDGDCAPIAASLPSIPEGATRLRIPVTEALSSEQRLEITDEIHGTREIIAEVEDQRTAVNNRLKGLHAKEDALWEQYESSSRTIDVDAYELVDHAAGVVRAFRADNGAPLRERPISDDERQLSIAAGGKAAERAGTESTGLTEEQRVASTPEEAEEMRERRLANEQDGRDEPLTASIGETQTYFGRTGDVQPANEAARAAELARLEAEQQADQQQTGKRLLKAPPRSKALKIVGQDDKPAATDLCAPACDVDHVHSEQRTAF